MVLTVPDAGAYEPDIKAIGRHILAAAGVQPPLILQPDWWESQALELANRDPVFRTQLLRFLEVFPTLRTVDHMASHIQEYFEDPSGELPPVLRWGIKAAWPGQLTTGLVARTIEYNLNLVSQAYIAGKTPADAAGTLRRLHREKAAVTLNMLGEGAPGARRAESLQKDYVEAIRLLSREAAHWPGDTPADNAPWGPAPRVSISLKLSSICPRLDPLDFDNACEVAATCLRPILRAARDQRAAVILDMEQFRLRDLTLAVVRLLFAEREFRDYPHLGVAVQAYLRDAEEDILDLVNLAHERSTPIAIRLVKGAYWEEEAGLAAREHWPSPVLLHKADTDAQFERLARLLVEHSDCVHPVIASHNPRSVACGLAACRAAGLPDTTIEWQVLLGMSQRLRKALVQEGLRVRVYAPVGDLATGMPYLARRMLETTSPESFLRLTGPSDKERERVLARPLPTPDLKHLLLERIDVHPTDPKEPGPFHNEPRLDFAREVNRLEMSQALAAGGGRPRAPPPPGPLVIGGHETDTGRIITSLNPAHPDQILGTVAAAGPGEAERAVQAARAAATEWRSTAHAERAAVLFRAADLMRRERSQLAALAILEAGKTWREADAEVIEAIDFLEYYGREILRIAEPRILGGVPGETNHHFYEPRGVAAVIAPWNFPLAILTGMTAAALVAGNTVVMKPASDTPLIAWELHRLLMEAGLPPAALAYLPGSGPEVGNYLVEHPEVNVIAFTGSSAVGLDIVRRAGVLRPGQVAVKHVVAEMGGKNAIIVDDDADLRSAVEGIAASAFGFGGQKCSACSRVIALESIHDRLLERLTEAAELMVVGDPALPGTDMGPLINPQAVAKVKGYIARGQEEARLAFSGRLPEDTGQPDAPAYPQYVAPHIFVDVDPHAAIAQEEIFGPVISMCRARDFDHALTIANSVAYGLTGGVYSRAPSHVRAAIHGFRVGNLYINRGITGAMVGRQPFGGFKHSGTGSRAGGPDYLLHFLEPRTVTEAARPTTPHNAGGPPHC